MIQRGRWAQYNLPLRGSSKKVHNIESLSSQNTPEGKREIRRLRRRGSMPLDAFSVLSDEIEIESITREIRLQIFYVYNASIPSI